MVVKVASKLRQATSRVFSPANVMGDGMLVRLRSTMIGILGLVAAVGLGLVGVVSQQGWPDVASGPPPLAPLGLQQNDSIAMPRSASERPAASRRPSRPLASAGSPVTTVSTPAGVDAGVGGVQADNPAGTGQPKPEGNHAQPPSQPTSPTVAIQVPSEEDAPAEGSSLPDPAEPSNSAPGHSGESHGHNGKSHGNSSAAPSHSSASSGQSSEAPGHSNKAPGNSGEAQGHSAKSLGRGH